MIVENDNGHQTVFMDDEMNIIPLSLPNSLFFGIALKTLYFKARGI